MSFDFLNPLHLFGSGVSGALQNGVEASYNGFGATKDLVNATGDSLSTPAAAPAPYTPDASEAAALAQLGLPPNASASDTYAAITREQWTNYVNTFQPIENQLISYATDTTQPAQAMAAARQDVDDQYATQAGTQARTLEGLGVTLRPDEQAAQSRQFGLSAALASVQGQNVAHDLTIQRQQGILGNPAPTVSSIAQQATGLGS